jgi:hypothetical protein
MLGSCETERARVPPAEKPRRAVREGQVRSIGRDSSARRARRRASRSWMALGKGEAGALE